MYQCIKAGLTCLIAYCVARLQKHLHGWFEPVALPDEPVFRCHDDISVWTRRRRLWRRNQSWQGPEDQVSAAKVTGYLYQIDKPSNNKYQMNGMVFHIVTCATKMFQIPIGVISRYTEFANYLPGSEPNSKKKEEKKQISRLQVITSFENYNAIRSGVE